jgi:serine/threonine-protein kinase
VNRRSFPTGQASTALLKALLRVLVDDKGEAAGERWLVAMRVTADELEDETRMIPLPSMHAALAAFEQLASRDAILRATPHLLDSDVLGVWVRALRGTHTPAEAFLRLDSADSEYGRTTRWETLESRRGWWLGRVSIAHDPSLEKDGLLHVARLTELSAVPQLFGYGGVRVTARAQGESRSAGLQQEFEVEWSVPDVGAGSAVGAAGGAVLGAIPFVAHLTSTAVSGVLLAAGMGAGALAGVVRVRDAIRTAEARAQSLRVQALERSLMLRELRGGEIGGQLEGSVAAGQYRIVRRMGSGATGVIYEAARISDGMPVAIKLLRAAAAHEAIASDRLRREAEALGLSWHPNVVEVIDEGHLADGTSYLVMELLRGESLAARLRSKTRLTPRELLPIAMQVCDALAAVHAAGVVHRDVKPSNVFLAVDRDDPAGPERVKLLDFGIARVEWEETRITNTGGPLGTPGYMSPEQETGQGEVDGRSDLFALGAMLFECLVGEPPPPRTSSGPIPTKEEAAIRFDSGTQKSASFVPAVWRGIIERAMQLSPNDRFQDARSFAAALRVAREQIAGAEASS